MSSKKYFTKRQAHDLFFHEFCRWPKQEKSVIQEKLIPWLKMKCSLKRKLAQRTKRGSHLECLGSKVAAMVDSRVAVGTSEVRGELGPDHEGSCVQGRDLVFYLE